MGWSLLSLTPDQNRRSWKNPSEKRAWRKISKFIFHFLRRVKLIVSILFRFTNGSQTGGCSTSQTSPVRASSSLSSTRFVIVLSNLFIQHHIHGEDGLFLIVDHLGHAPLLKRNEHKHNGHRSSHNHKHNKENTNKENSCTEQLCL